MSMRFIIRSLPFFIFAMIFPLNFFLLLPHDTSIGLSDSNTISLLDKVVSFNKIFPLDALSLSMLLHPIPFTQTNVPFIVAVLTPLHMRTLRFGLTIFGGFTGGTSFFFIFCNIASA